MTVGLSCHGCHDYSDVIIIKLLVSSVLASFYSTERRGSDSIAWNLILTDHNAIRNQIKLN